MIVTDSRNHRIRLIYPNLTVSTLAGNSQGNSNGVGTMARVSLPGYVAVDFLGNTYVSEWNNHKIRLIYPNLTVVTLAGGSSSGSTMGSINGVGSAALFGNPTGVVADPLGNLIVADHSSHKIRLIYPNRTVITLVGGNLSGTTLGSTNGVGTAALFNSPMGIAIDSSGNVFVSEFGNHNIRLVYPFMLSCSPGAYANTTSRSCTLCPPGSSSATGSAPSCSLCPGGTFTASFGSSSCPTCPGGHYCPPGTASWARLNCGRGSFCPAGSAAPIPCPPQVPPSGGSWASAPQQVQGPAFLLETASCRSHCFWNFSSGDGFLSKC